MNNDFFLDDCGAELVLQDCAFDTLRDNPGLRTFDAWRNKIFEDYPHEVVLGISADAFQVDNTLREWWTNERYFDVATELTKTFAEWADVFATEQSVDIYTKYSNLIALVHQN